MLPKHAIERKNQRISTLSNPIMVKNRNSEMIKNYAPVQVAYNNNDSEVAEMITMKKRKKSKRPKRVKHVHESSNE